MASSVLRSLGRQAVITNHICQRTLFTGRLLFSTRTTALMVGGAALVTTAVGNTLYQKWKSERNRAELIRTQVYFDPDKREVVQQKSCIDPTPVPVSQVLAQRVSREVPGRVVIPGVKLTLFQYQTCPFCCKVRTFLDYYGIGYNVVEVNPVLRQQLKFTKYKKVPILVITKEPGNKDDFFVDDSIQLNDSTLIISLLASYFTCNPGLQDNLNQMATMYPSIAIADFEDNKTTNQVVNKYFLMKGDHMSEAEYKKVIKGLSEERKWREWADNVLVHTLSPNIYQTLEQSFYTFDVFSNMGDWEHQFPAWERFIVKNVGAIAMYFVAKRLKKRHHLKEDVRDSLFDAIHEWQKVLGKSRFLGGKTPNLADLAVFGVLHSIEGTDAFGEIMFEKKLRSWYVKVKAACAERQGSSSIIPLVNDRRGVKTVAS